MDCTRAREIDLLGFVAHFRAGGAAPRELRAFRDHYPACPDCARAVAEVSDLHRLLDAAHTRPDHPAVEELAALESDPSLLHPSRRRAVESHLRACPTCRDECAALRHRPAPGRPGPKAPRERRNPLAALAAGLRGLALHPAFTWALILALTYPAIRGLQELSPSNLLADALREPAPELARALEERPADAPVSPPSAPVAIPLRDAGPAAEPAPAVQEALTRPATPEAARERRAAEPVPGADPRVPDASKREAGDSRREAADAPAFAAPGAPAQAPSPAEPARARVPPAPAPLVQVPEPEVPSAVARSAVRDVAPLAAPARSPRTAPELEAGAADRANASLSELQAGVADRPSEPRREFAHDVSLPYRLEGRRLELVLSASQRAQPVEIEVRSPDAAHALSRRFEDADVELWLDLPSDWPAGEYVLSLRPVPDGAISEYPLLLGVPQPPQPAALPSTRPPAP